MIRKSAVHDIFYPANPIMLADEIKSHLKKAKVHKKYKNVLGIIAPHAGYIYSGKTAAYAYNSIQDSKAKKIIILAPSHRYNHFDFSVGNFDLYETPLGMVKVVKEDCEKLLKQKGFSFLEEVHYKEHSLEVQLPFLQGSREYLSIIPILIGKQNLDNAKILAKAIYELIKDNLDEYLVVVSSDLSHFYPQDIAAIKDGRFSDLVNENNPFELWKNIEEHNIEACGFCGILTLLILSKKLKKNKVDILDYTHSGKVSGDNNEVVGYLSAVVSR